MKISEISKRNIIDVLTEGLINGDFYYFGRFEEIDFLNRLINLKELPSSDSQFNNMSEDIWQHTVNNEDWDIEWAFYDSRLNFLHDDEMHVKLIEEIFHPLVRSDEYPWGDFIRIINEILIYDKLKLVSKNEISGRSVYTIEPLVNSSLINDFSEQIKTKFSSEYIDSQVTIMLDNIESNPNVAIGKSKELLESCAKTILFELGVDYDEKMKFNSLLKLVMQELDLSANNQNKEKDSGIISAKILGNLGAIPQNMAELRNIFGDGHGKSSTFVSLPPRYARLAVGTSVTIVYFLWETYQDRKSIF